MTIVKSGLIALIVFFTSNSSAELLAAHCDLLLSAVDAQLNKDLSFSINLNRESHDTFVAERWIEIDEKRAFWIKVSFLEANLVSLPRFNILSYLWSKNRKTLLHSAWDGGSLDLPAVDDSEYFSKAPERQKETPYSKQTLIHDTWAFNESLKLGFKYPDLACREGKQQNICKHFRYYLLQCHIPKKN